ncbi:MAG: S-layer homology domain-containing protein, partial [Elainella sp.]
MSPLKQSFKQSVLLSSLAALALLPLASCANAPWANQLENSLAADPQLQARVEASPTADPTATVQLPANFPAEIPRYPNATLVAVSGAEAVSGADSGTDSANVTNPNPASPADPTLGQTQPVRTRWQTSDSAEQVQQFYQTQFQTNGWQLSPAAGNAPNAALQASRDGLQVVVAAQPGNDATELTIQYRLGDAVVASPSDGSTPQVGNSGANNSGPIGPVLPSPTDSANNSNTPVPDTGFADLEQAPAELRSYITDLAKLGVLGNQANFNPNGEITRRQYALWLVKANNQIYANQPARQIRLASGSTDKPVFQDLPPSD